MGEWEATFTLHPHYTRFILLEAEKINTREGRLAHRYGDLGPQLDCCFGLGPVAKSHIMAEAYRSKAVPHSSQQVEEGVTGRKRET